jgi:hypothetical protein
MKKFFKIFGWVCLGIFLQFKFSVLYGIVFLENLNFHDRTYFISMKLNPIAQSTQMLNVKTTVHHSLGPDYFANVYIPKSIKVYNANAYKGAEPIKGYIAYQMNMKRKYRDVLASQDFIISSNSGEKLPPTPILVHFENMKQRLHSDKTYLISTLKSQTILKGPEKVAVKYPQSFGM